jgi:hypothetical protein
VNKKILISTPFPSLDEVARELGISKSRQKKIEKLVDGIIAADTSEPRVRMRRGLDGRHRDKDGTIEMKRGDTLVRTLRKEYGHEFAPGYRSDAKLETVKKQEGVASLGELLKPRKLRA